MKVYQLRYHLGEHELSNKVYRTKKKALKVLSKWAEDNGWHVDSFMANVDTDLGTFYLRKLKVVL